MAYIYGELMVCDWKMLLSLMLLPLRHGRPPRIHLTVPLTLLLLVYSLIASTPVAAAAAVTAKAATTVETEQPATFFAAAAAPNMPSWRRRLMACPIPLGSGPFPDTFIVVASDCSLGGSAMDGAAVTVGSGQKLRIRGQAGTVAATSVPHSQYPILDRGKGSAGNVNNADGKHRHFVLQGNGELTLAYVQLRGAWSGKTCGLSCDSFTGRFGYRLLGGCLCGNQYYDTSNYANSRKYNGDDSCACANGGGGVKCPCDQEYNGGAIRIESVLGTLVLMSVYFQGNVGGTEHDSTSRDGFHNVYTTDEENPNTKIYLFNMKSNTNGMKSVGLYGGSSNHRVLQHTCDATTNAMCLSLNRSGCHEPDQTNNRGGLSANIHWLYCGCPLGFYGPSDMGKCTACSAGQYSDTTGPLTDGPTENPELYLDNQCKVCPAGRWSAEGAAFCTNCTAGRYLTDAGTDMSAHSSETSCLVCGRGKYQPDPGQTSCTTCPEGKTIESYRADAHVSEDSCILDCLPTQHANDDMSACVDCADGFACDGFSRIECDPGSYCFRGRKYFCPPGSFGETIGAANMSEGCQNCTAGTYQIARGQTFCTECAAGLYSDTPAQTTRQGCKDCENLGYFCPKGSQFPTQFPCPNGTFSDQPKATRCHTCPAGRYQDNAPAEACKRCHAGRFLTDQGSAPVLHDELDDCAICGTNTYQNTEGQSNCKGCPLDSILQDPGTMADKHKEQSQCVRSCTPGKYAVSVGPCKLCEPGWRCDGGPSNRIQCPAGFYCAGSSIAPDIQDLTLNIFACTPGRYGTHPGQSNASHGCQDCPAGRFQPVEGQISCDQTCPRGKFGNKVGQRTEVGACQPCPRGYKCPRIAMTRPEPCGLGTYMSAPAWTEITCTPCPKARYNERNMSAVSKDACAPCASGRYTLSTGAKFASECVVVPPSCTRSSGQYPSGGDGLCSNCPAGFRANGLGTGCVLCPRGWYSPTEGNTACTRCQGEHTALCDAAPGTTSMPTTSEQSATPVGFDFVLAESTPSATSRSTTDTARLTREQNTFENMDPAMRNILLAVCASAGLSLPFRLK